jgi:hypothetical protein
MPLLDSAAGGEFAEKAPFAGQRADVNVIL